MSEKYPGGFVTYNPPTPSQTSATGIWTLSQQQQYQQAGLWPNSPSQISRSLRFNQADSTSLSRTPTYSGNLKTWTWSAWIKRTNLSDYQYSLFGASVTSANYDEFRFNTSDQFRFFIVSSSSIVLDLLTTQVFRDPSAWYHLVVAYDSTQATSSDRAKLYVNGVQVTSFATATYPSQNQNTTINSNALTRIGLSQSGFLLNCYMANVQFVDGQALDPTSFGEYNANTGVWQPLQKNLTYGTNGFQLTFNDNTNTTATTLGADSSGNGNNFTPTNFSVTAGAGNDSMVDSPTSYGTDTGLGGEVRGNYATLNPLKKKSTATISNGNLALVATSSLYVTGLSTISPSSGTYYMEMLCSGSNSNRPWGIGVVNADASADASVSNTGTYFVTNNSGSTVNYYVGGSPTALATSSTWVAGDIISLAWNVDSGKFWVGRNGVWYPSSTGGTVASNADVAAGNYPTFTISYSGNTNPQVIPAFVTYDTTASIDANFGQRPFAYTAPSGFKALCTQNLPTPTIGATSTTLATKYFNPVLYTGNGSTLTVTGVGFQPDWVWLKARSSGGSSFTNNVVIDSVRGSGTYGYKNLYTNTTEAEYDPTSGNASVNSLNSDGFVLGGNSNTNYNTMTAVAWNWKANGSGSTNTSGSITSTVSANTTSGFSVVTYTGTGSNATVGHGLGVAPKFIITKKRSSTSNWATNDPSQSNPWSGALLLNTTDAFASSSAVWNNTAPTTTVFSIGTADATNISSATYVAYCFAAVAGYSAFGSYTGNGSADGVFVYTGFRPAYVLIKRTTSAYDWWILDAARGTINAVKGRLYANAADAESTTYPYLDFLSNGFKLRDADGGLNASGEPYIYACFAQNPFKYSLAR